MRQAPIILLLLLLSASLPARADADREVVRVNGTPIRQSEVMERLWQRYGDQTLEEMIDELLLRQEAQKEGVKVSPAEIDKRFSQVKSQFTDPKIMEAQLEQYGSSVDKLKQQIGEEIGREKVVLSRKKLAVTEDELREAFKLHKEDLGKPAAVHLRHILVATQADADQIVAAVKKGADFTQLAREKSLAPTGKLNGGDYGYVSKGMLPPEIEDIAFAMQPGEIKVFPSAKGFHIVQSVGKRAAVPAEYSQVKDDLRQILLQEKIKQAMPDVLKDLRAKADIAPAAKL